MLAQFKKWLGANVNYLDKKLNCASVMQNMSMLADTILSKDNLLVHDLDILHVVFVQALWYFVPTTHRMVDATGKPLPWLFASVQDAKNVKALLQFPMKFAKVYQKGLGLESEADELLQGDSEEMPGMGGGRDVVLDVMRRTADPLPLGHGQWQNEMTQENRCY
jgi:hypothetical protein